MIKKILKIKRFCFGIFGLLGLLLIEKKFVVCLIMYNFFFNLNEVYIIK